MLAVVKHVCRDRSSVVKHENADYALCRGTPDLLQGIHASDSMGARMTPLRLAKLKQYAKSQGVNLKEWERERPHFGGLGPHRYEAEISDYLGGNCRDKVCVYCLKPENEKEN